ncbi:tetratricopeptide repeat protein [Ectothiorhodospira lacustris]|uniref:tetratricopeptide repeat protein n=1 Tax=Ectothiorhodospira lacustris TaxID=2899127 RepID=UPI001EE7CD68|nr:tetratricopeptide repeat protein [Ectothiorhodospira lacustris]MCG5508842.1 tetratricopeptide repeat protein [Ectothiorhodospira lacustris]MCG5520633.1 tetratricopeptide repeat protein [Ectothiorhodospira lacustris]
MLPDQRSVFPWFLPRRPVPRLGAAVVLCGLLAACAGLSRDGEGYEEPWQPLAEGHLLPLEGEGNGVSDLLYELLVGEIAGHQGELQVAVEHYLRAAQRTRNPEVAERATRIALFAGDPAAALPGAERWLALEPENLEARQILAALLVNEGRPDAAAPHLLTVLERVEAVEGDGYGLLVNMLARSQNGDAALEALALVAESRGDDSLAYLAVAGLALQQDRPLTAVAAAERALTLDDGLREAHVLRARALGQAGDQASSLRAMGDLVARYPEDVDLRVTYARLLLQSERYEDARRQFERVARERPGDADLLYTLGLLNIEVEQYEDAQRYLERVLQTGRRVQEARYYLGRIAEAGGDPERAIRFYAQVNRGEHRDESVIRAALLKGGGGQLAQARADLSALRDRLDEPGERVRVYLAEAGLLRDARDYEAGMDLLHQGLREYPGNPELLYSRALMAERLDRIDQVEADLNLILAQDPDNAAALNALGYTLADRTDRHEEAYGYIRRAYAQRPDDAAVIDSMGWVLYRLGRLDEAEVYLRRAHDMMEDSEIASNLAALLWAQGRRDEALGILRKALERDPAHERLLRLKERLDP